MSGGELCQERSLSQSGMEAYGFKRLSGIHSGLASLMGSAWGVCPFS